MTVPQITEVPKVVENPDALGQQSKSIFNRLANI